MDPKPKGIERPLTKVDFPDRLRSDTMTFFRSLANEDLVVGDSLEKALLQKIEGEESFYKRVLEAVLKAKQDNPSKTVVVLFDLDETLFKIDLSKTNGSSILRPSAINLLSRIRDMDVKIGLLTSRGNLKDQLEDPLKEISGFIDDEYLFSSRGIDVFYRELQQIKVDLSEEQEISFSDGDYVKIKQLRQIMEDDKFANTVFIPVDDFKYPSLFLYGVALSNNERFSLVV